MKILIASILPIRDRRYWSGINAAIYHQLSVNHEVETCYSPSAHGLQQFLSKLSYYTYKLFGVRINVYFSASVARLYAKTLRKKVEALHPDLLVVLGSGTEVYAYKPSCPSYLIADANFYLLQDQYSAYSSLLAGSIAQAKKVEAQSLVKFDLIFQTSEWALDSTKAHYPQLASKLRKINFGSNLDSPDFVDLGLPSTLSHLKLLAVGTDYHRKGVDRAEKLANDLGASLICIGTHLNVNKELEPEQQMLIDAYKSAHFLILLSRADCTPIVVCEANQYGLPVIATNVGGISSIIENNVNGYLVEDSFEAEDLIRKIICQKEAYSLLRKSTFDYYHKNLTWAKFERTLLSEII